MAVTRCVCFRKRFSELKRLAEARGWQELADVARATGCTTGCGSCAPYIRAMLVTGHTSFAVRDGDGPPRPCAPEPWDEA